MHELVQSQRRDQPLLRCLGPVGHLAQQRPARLERRRAGGQQRALLDQRRQPDTLDARLVAERVGELDRTVGPAQRLVVEVAQPGRLGQHGHAPSLGYSRLDAPDEGRELAAERRSSRRDRRVPS